MSASFQVKLFGPPAITLNGQAVTGFISSKATATIFYLAATGQPQARDVLAALLWSNSPEFYAKKNLRNVLSNLRDLLGDFLEISRETVNLRLHAGDRVDSADFAVCITQATKLPEKSSARNTLLAEAISLYHGPFLDGFHIADADTFDEWLRAEREHYQRLAIQALNELVAYHAHQGELLIGMAYATRLLALDPLSEETHRHLMLLSALDGQTSAAMAHYRACQKLLQAELGVQPAPETQQLYARILAGEFSKPTSTLSGILPIAPVVPRPRLTLPAELTSFIGREAEIAKIERQLSEPACRLVTIIGMGGVGKTRMALRVAHLNAEFGVRSAESPQRTPHSELRIPHFPDGIGFVSLAALEANDQIAHQLATAIAASLQLPLTGSTAPADQLIQALYDKELLLILDNCEHLPVAAFISPLLQQTRKLKLLVTSRTRLNVRGEQLIQLAGLAMPGQSPATTTEQPQEYGAIQLFVQCVQALLPAFSLDEATTVTVMQICQLLHGLPLGIELAATWVRHLSLTEIAQEIQQNLDFLDNPLVDAPLHQRSLRAVFNYSWRLLSASEQQALRRLAVFRGGFSREAANQVAGATLPLLASLTDKSLLQRAGSINDWPEAKARYELHNVIHQYAVEQLAQAGETAELQSRHAEYVSGFLAARQADLESTRQQDALREIHSEIENIRAAWQWLLDHFPAHHEGLAEIEKQVGQSFVSLFHFYDMRSWFPEGETVFGRLARQLPTFSPLQLPAGKSTLALWRLQARAQARQGWFAFHLGHYAESRRLLEQSLHNLRQLGAEAETVFNLNYLGALLRYQGEFVEAEGYLQTGLALAQAHDDRLGASIALNTLGQVAFLQGDYPQTQVLCRQALAIKQAIGDRWGMTYSLTSLGRVAQATGDYAAAQTLFAQSLTICRAIGDQRGAAIALQNLGDTAQRSGQLASAQAHYNESLQIYQAIGSRAEASLLLARLGEVACANREYPLASDHLHEALTLAWSVQAALGLLATLLGLATVALATDQPAQAVAPLRLVQTHPASSQAQKEQAEQLLAASGVDAQALESMAVPELATYVQGQLRAHPPTRI